MRAITDMISVTKFGRYWRLIYLVSGDNGVELPRITVALSMPYSGFFAQVLLGEISLQTTGNGAQYINGSFVGAEKESGENCWIF